MKTLKDYPGLSILLIAAFLLLASGNALADPPTRVARLAHIDGVVSFAPAGEDEWALANVNRPFTTGDRIWSDTGSRAELQVGDAWVRLGASTSATFLNLDNRIAQLQLAQGVLNLRVSRTYGDQSYEVDTPNLALTVRQPGEYRIEVDPANNTTTVSDFRGVADVYGENNSYSIGERQRYRFSGTDLRDYEYLELAPPDQFDRWAFDRDRRTDTSVSARYVSPEVIGYADLDDYGTWSTVSGYGAVWTPTHVDPGWAPYREGHWAWIDPWGWTWVDDAPWGFAPFHYGRWAYLRDRWCWVPGPRRAEPVYAPALVAFVGGRNFTLSVSSGPAEGVAWFPLAPGEVYRPAYNVSRNYFTNVNVSNTNVNVTTITNVYNWPETNVVYRNREAPRSVTAVPVEAFATGRPVARSVVPVSHEAVARAQVTDVAPVAPTRASIVAGAPSAVAGAKAPAKPPTEVVNRPVVAKTAPAPTPAPFAARERELAAHPGRPIEITAASAAAAKSGASPSAAKSAAVPEAAKSAAPANVKVVAPTTPKPAPPRAEAAKATANQPTPGPTATTGAAPNGAPQPPGAPQPQVSARPPGAEGASKEALKQPPSQANVPRPAEAARAAPQEAPRGLPPQANVPRPPGAEKVPPQAKAPTPAEARRGGPQEPVRGAPPQASVPRPPEAQQAPQQALRAPPPQANVPRPPQAAKAPEEPAPRPAQASAPRPPEPQRATPPSQASVAPEEPVKAPPAQALRAPAPQASAPRPPEAAKAPPQALRAPAPQAPAPAPPQAQRAEPREPPHAPPPQAVAPRPQEAPKAPPPQAMRAPPPQAAARAPEPPRASVQRAPEPPKGAPPGAAPAPPPQANVAKAPEPQKPQPPQRGEEKKKEEGK